MFSSSQSGPRTASIAVSAGQSSRATLQVAFVAAAAFVVACGVFAYVRTAYAGIGDIFVLGIAWVFQTFTGWLGNLLLIVVGALIYIATYNGFVTSAPVANGWSIVRDVTNMFFILVLLVIAFGTILGVDAYSYKNKMLSRLLIMAVVVNFSRTICGLLIDFAQVVMLTFVYGFRDAAGGNFIEALRITQVMQARQISDTDSGVTAFSIAIASILAFFLILIALVVVILMTITLAIRIVYLWLLVVLSPLAFFLKAVPGGAASGYYGMWWKMFTGQVVVGPVMAFFLWLSLVSVASGNLSTAGFTGQATTGEEVSGPITEGFRGTEIQTFIISICLLMGGLQISKQISSESAGAAPGVAKKALSLGTRAAKGVGRAGLAVGRGGASLADKASGGRISLAQDALLSKATKFAPVRGMAAEALAKRRTERDKKAGERSKMLGALTPEARNNMANAMAWTGDQKVNKKEALRAALKDKADNPPKDEKGRQEFFRQKKELSALGDTFKDGSVKKDLGMIEQKRPSLIIDNKETDLKERARQEGAFRKAASGFNASKMADMDPGELTPQFLAFANPKAIFEAQKSASGDQLAKLSAMGDSEQKIRDKQDMLKRDPANFGLASEQDRANLVSNMTRPAVEALAKSDAVRPDHLSGQVVEALAKNGNAGIVAEKVAASLDPAKLRDKDGGPTSLARQVADGLNNDRGAAVLAALPEGIASVLRPLVGEKNALVALNGGATMKEVLPAYDNATGNVTDAASKAKLDELVKADPAKAAAAIPIEAYQKNGGMNDTTISVVNNMNMNSVNSVADSGNTGQAAAIMDAIQEMAQLTEDDIKAALEGSNLSSSLDEVKHAVEQSKQIAEEVKKNTNPLDAELRQQQIVNKMAASEERNAARLEGAERRITGKKRGKKT